jgi:FixJ family two-component response regulator
MKEFTNSFGSPINVLHIEDSESDAILIELTLSAEFSDIQFTRVETEAGLRQQLSELDVHVIFSDYSMPGFSGKEALKICQEERPYVPFIFVSGTIGEVSAVEALRNGAVDYVLKNHMSRLPNSFYQAMVMQHDRNAKKEAEEKLRTTLENLEDLVEVRTKNLEIAKKELQEKNTKLKDSINYAKHIQDAFTRELNADVFGVTDLFVLGMPRDVLSGDFHWGHYDAKHNCSYLAVGDCTGHGIPGALLTILAVQLLEQYLLAKKKKQDTKKVIMYIDAAITDFLRQSEYTSMLNDGMELALFRIDHSEKTMYFTNVGLDVYCYQKGSKSVIRGHKSMVGGAIRVQTQNSDVHCVNYESGDKLYAFSDGYRDQFGGGNGKKMLRKRKEAHLKDIQSKPFKKHRSLLEDYFVDWKGDNFQVDDMIVLGLEL